MTTATTTNFDSTVAAIERESGHSPTHFQVSIFKFLAAVGHAIVNAVAGSGKTTTLMQALKFIPAQASVLIVAFNKHIADEINSRELPANASASTLHSVGMRVLNRNVKNRVRVDTRKTHNLLKALMGYDQMNADGRTDFWAIQAPICRLVSLFKNFGYGFLRDYPTTDEIYQLAYKYNIELPDEHRDLFLAHLETVYRNSFKPSGIIDFDDMLAVPIAEKWDFPTADFVFVDESQDLNGIQVEIVKQLVRNGGRAIFVGDRNQAIYGFRGADPEAMDTILRDFDATELPLSICWRCPRLIVELAKKIVPQIEAAPNAIEGEIRDIKTDDLENEVQTGSYVLCRVTAPLVGHCLAAIRAGKKAMVRGRDIGQGLIAMVKKVQGFARSGDGLDLYTLIEGYGVAEAAKLDRPGKEAALMTFNDKIDTLLVLAEGCESFDDMKSRIEKIFSDNDAGIVFSTVHKAKGLEAEDVFILAPELMPHPLAKQDWQIQQEYNLLYVAITRSMKRLTWVK